MPEALLERIIKVSSNPGDIVCDPFAGSGTTLAVAKRLGRRYLGIELSEAYAAQIEARLAQIPPPSMAEEMPPDTDKKRAGETSTLPNRRQTSSRRKKHPAKT
jgi:site-specific DNA-methyltransferase (adenine-specific)